MKFVGIRRVENAGQILKWKYIKSKLEFVEGDSTMNIEAQFNLIAEEYDCNRRKLDKECSMETEIQIPQAFLNAPVLNREEHD